MVDSFHARKTGVPFGQLTFTTYHHYRREERYLKQIDLKSRFSKILMHGNFYIMMEIRFS